LSPGYIQNQNRRFSVMKSPIFCHEITDFLA
jgi:hypothetical protein